jgi:hypothetical protein
MSIKAALLHWNLLNDGNQIHNFITCRWELLYILLWFRSAEAKSGSYGFGTLSEGLNFYLLINMALVICLIRQVYEEKSSIFRYQKCDKNFRNEITRSMPTAV